MNANKANLTFGQRIRELRQANGISLRKFAEMLVLSATFISKVERDEDTTPSLDNIRKMAKILSADVDELIILAGKMPEDLPEIIKSNPKEMAVLLRTVNELSAKDRNALMRQLTGDNK